MKEHRFSLQKYRPGSKLTCPRCGRRQCFTRYVDNDGLLTLPDNVGRCDHEVSCGYHYPPAQYFKDNPLAHGVLPDPRRLLPPVRPAAPAIAEPSFIDKKVMDSSLTSYSINPLYQFLSRHFGEEETRRLFRLYNVGTARQWGGSTVFWLVDGEGRVRSGKVMLYNLADGHRVKEQHPHISWVHSLLRLPDFILRQCLFGEHLLSTRPTAHVALVESEKTAIVAAHFIPCFLWLATGGLGNLRPAEALRGRDVLLVPDLGAEEKWRAKLPELATVCRSVAVSKTLSAIATDEQRSRGLDIADYLLMGDTPQMVLQQMIARNPYIQTLVDALGMTIVDDG